MKYIYSLFVFIIISTISLQAQDWANLNRFKNENAKLPAPGKKENRVVFMGNSITEGWINLRPEFFSQNPYINRGIGGQTTPQMLLRFHQDVIDLQPKVVVILAGTNDIAGNTGPSTLKMIEDNISAMTEIAKAHKIKVVLISVLPAYEYGWAKHVKPVEKIAELNKWLEEFAQKNKFEYVDCYTPMLDNRKGMKDEYTKDGVHPTAEGYKVMEPLVVKAINKALKKK